MVRSNEPTVSVTAILDRSSDPATTSTDSLRGWGSAVLDALGALRAGQPIIFRYDDEAGFETGDLLLAAVHADPAMMAFYLQRALGPICVALSSERSEELGLAATPTDGAVHCSPMAFSAMADETTARPIGTICCGAVSNRASVRRPCNPPRGSVTFREHACRHFMWRRCAGTPR